MTPLRPILILAIAAWLIFIAGGVISRTDPGFLIFMSGLVVISGGVTFAVLVANMRRLVSLYDAFPYIAQELGGEVRKNALGEQQVSVPGPHGGRWILDHRSRPSDRSGPSRVTVMGWRSRGLALPEQELLLGSKHLRADHLPAAAAEAVDALREALPEVVLKLHPAGFFFNEDEISLMWPGHTTTPRALEELIVRSQELLAPLIDALATPTTPQLEG